MPQFPYSAYLVLGSLLVAIVIGLAAKRRRAAQLILAGIGPLYSIGLLAFLVVEGTTSRCTGQGTTFRCIEVTYASTWSAREWLVVAALTLLSLTPIAALWLRTRIPSAIGSVALPLLIVIAGVAFTAWLPAWLAVYAAAIAGPPLRGVAEKPGANLPVF